MHSIKPSRIELPTNLGYSVTAFCYEPESSAKAGLVIACALGVEQSFYSSLAGHLAGIDYQVWTFDYYGIGESKPASMRTCEADISSWVKTDFDAIIQHANSSMAGLPLFVLGHSLGGLITPFLPSIKNISGIINIAVGSGAKHYMHPRVQRSTPFLWHLVLPALCSIFGYFPGSRIGVVGNVPRRAMYQWREWCLNPEYLLDSEPDARPAYAAINCPMLSLFFTDDELILESGAGWLHDAYTGTQVDYRVISASEVELSRIGHFGYFKQRQHNTLWTMVSDWLSATTNGTS